MTDLINIVENNGQLVVSSREVARNFGKRHDHVIRHIEEVIRGIPHLGNTPMFFKNTYIHEQNNQKYAEYIMNRDGFSLLVMGFTGKSALEWKLKYIEAFNAMEQKLKTLSLPDFTNPVVAARAWADAMEDKLAADKKIKELEPKAEIAEHFIEKKHLVNFQQLAREIPFPLKQLMDILSKWKMIFRDKKSRVQPYYDAKNKGYMIVKDVYCWQKSSFTLQTLVTMEGKEYIRKRLIKEGYITEK